MPDQILACGILRRELEHLLGDGKMDIVYLNAALHVDDNKLAKGINTTLNNMGSGIPVVMGAHCHPDMEQLVAQYSARLIKANSCIDMILGEEKARLDTEAILFTLPPGGWKTGGKFLSKV